VRTCPSCGFENAEPGKACALCGASEVTPQTSELSTLAAPAGQMPLSASTARVEAGRVFGERYRVVSLLGSGGMGQVFRVEDLRSGPVEP